MTAPLALRATPSGAEAIRFQQAGGPELTGESQSQLNACRIFGLQTGQCLATGFGRKSWRIETPAWRLPHHRPLKARPGWVATDLMGTTGRTEP